MAGYFDDLVPVAPPAGAAPAAQPSSAPLVFNPGHGISVEVGGSDPAGAGPTPAPAAAPPPQAALPAGVFDDLVPQRMQNDYLGGVTSAIGDAAGKLWSDIGEAYHPPAYGANAGQEGARAWRQFTSVPRIAGDVFGLLASPVEGGVIQPAARLMDRIPLDAYSTPSLSIDGSGLHVNGPQRLSAIDKHDANAHMLHIALAAARAPAALTAPQQALADAHFAAFGGPAPEAAAVGVAPATAAEAAPGPEGPAVSPVQGRVPQVGDAPPAAAVSPAPAAAPASPPPEAPAVNPVLQGRVPQVGDAVAPAASPNVAPSVSQSFTPAPRAAAPAASGGELSKPMQRVLQFINDRLPEGVTPDTIAAADPQLTGAEAAGRMMGDRLDTWAKQPGATAEGLADRMELRRSSRPGEILNAAANSIGVHPGDAQGVLDKIVETGQGDARPLYDLANAFGPVWNEKLARIASTDAGKQAMKYARTLMSNEMEDPHALGMTFAEDPEQWASYTPPPLSAGERGPVGFAGGPRGPARAPSQGPSLAKFIANNGGLSPADGELAGMGADRWHVGRPFQRSLVGTGSADDMALRAQEAGYFPDYEGRPTTNDLYDALRDEMRGKALYSRHPDVEALQKFDGANASEEHAYYGSDPADVPSPEQYTGRPEPQSEAVLQHVPNAKTVDYVKRGFDQLIDKHTATDGTIDKVGQTIVNLKQQWVDEAKDLNPYYGAALDKATEYLGPKDAGRFGKNSFFLPSTTPQALSGILAKAAPEVVKGMRLGVAEKLRATIGDRNGVNQAISLLGPTAADNREKLGILLGRPAAQKFIDAIDQQKAMRDFESGLKNSKTAGRLALMDEQQAPGHVQGAVDAAKSALKMGPEKAFWAGIHSIMEHGIDRMASPLIGQAERDAGGPLLYGSPQELARMLRLYQEQQPKAFGPAASYTIRRGMIGSSAPGSN